MPFLTANYIWTARAPRNATTGQTLAEQPYLQKIKAHVENNTTSEITLPDVAFKASYYCQVDSGTDIVREDLITKITLLDAVTPWPAIRPGPITQMPGVGGALNLIFRVVYVRETPAMLLPCREVWFDALEGGGPA